MPATQDVLTSPRISHEDLDAGGKSEADAINVTLIEDSRLVAEALTELFSRCPDIRATAEAPDDHEKLLLEFSPDVILLNLRLENGDSLRWARVVLDDFPEARIVVMDLRPAHEALREFVSAGVSGFITKDAPLDVVLDTIRSVASGLKVLPDQLTASLFCEIAGEGVRNAGSNDYEEVQLTPREREVIDLVADGLSNKAIGKQLHISAHTVKSHLRNIMDKLTLNSRLQIAAYVHKRHTEGSG